MLCTQSTHQFVNIDLNFSVFTYKNNCPGCQFFHKRVPNLSNIHFTHLSIILLTGKLIHLSLKGWRKKFPKGKKLIILNKYKITSPKYYNINNCFLCVMSVNKNLCSLFSFLIIWNVIIKHKTKYVFAPPKL